MYKIPNEFHHAIIILAMHFNLGFVLTSYTIQTFPSFVCSFSVQSNHSSSVPVEVFVMWFEGVKNLN